VITARRVCTQSMLSAAVKYRQSVAQLYQYSTENVARLVTEFVPWTASASERDVIRRQVCTNRHRRRHNFMSIMTHRFCVRSCLCI